MALFITTSLKAWSWDFTYSFYLEIFWPCFFFSLQQLGNYRGYRTITNGSCQPYIPLCWDSPGKSTQCETTGLWPQTHSSVTSCNHLPKYREDSYWGGQKIYCNHNGRMIEWSCILMYYSFQSVMRAYRVL